jgi:hypothetical protein
LPGVVFLALGMLFVGLHPGLKRCQRAPDHLPWLALCALVAGSWYVLMYYLHGDALWDELKEDQISNRLDRPFWKPAVQLPQYAMLLAASFLPWLIPLVRRGNRLREFWASTDSDRRSGMLLIFLWSGLYLLMAANVERVNLRYLLPIVPLLAPLAAAWLVAAGEQVNGRWVAHVLRLALVLLVLVGMAAALVGVWFGDWLPGLLGAATAVLLAAALWRLSQGRSWFAQAQLLNISMLALLPVGFLCMKPVALPDVGQRIHQELTLLHADQAREIHFFGKAAVASRLRLLTQGSVPIHNLPWFHTASASEWPVLVLIDTRVDRLNLVGYDLHRFTHGYHRLPLGGAAQAFCQGRLSEYLARHERPIVIATARPLPAVAR